MYIRFGDNDVVTRQAQELVTSTWSNNANNIATYYTSSKTTFTTATSSGHFFMEIKQDLLLKLNITYHMAID
jgi:hypothetical protein